MAQEKCTGVVNWFSNQKGFGFIKPDGGGEDLFVHQTSIVSDGFRSLGEGDSVEFDVVLGDDGRSKAVDVALLDRSSAVGGRRDAYNRGARSAVSGGGFGAGWRSGGDRGGGYGRSGGDRGGGYGRSGGGGGCYNCGQPGHLARECTRGGGGGGGGGGCYSCGEVGHMARECPASGVGGGGGACFSCGQVGHMARECPQGGGGGGGSYGRFGSGGGGPRGGGGGGGGCYNCGGQGHIARECPNNL